MGWNVPLASPDRLSCFVLSATSSSPPRWHSRGHGLSHAGSLGKASPAQQQPNHPPVIPSIPSLNPNPALCHFLGRKEPYPSQIQSSRNTQTALWGNPNPNLFNTTPTYKSSPATTNVLPGPGARLGAASWRWVNLLGLLGLISSTRLGLFPAGSATASWEPWGGHWWLQDTCASATCSWECFPGPGWAPIATSQLSLATSMLRDAPVVLIPI